MTPSEDRTERIIDTGDLGAWDIDDEPESDDEEFDCGMDRHGNCGKAGSEECDFECPYRDIKGN